ncbi:nucleotidyltransferase domain-containing protein [Metallosphaera javensis (ex Hofmann et al. 2022)]|uniref:nucleotidyltransferase domain-containing protein n=1 Tax=Metallosphaera javensis (ex Hofmann et al. 2022) TaxID=99938 RepID=UPI0029FF51C3|nr:nucleotidyltransferase domain-containing protein [Metallosphaera javensis (ex Hofmann et al. 2022)]
MLEERRKQREAVLLQVKTYAEEWRKSLGKVTVVLYGSYARGDFNLWSDVDLVLISEKFAGVRFLDRFDMFRIGEGFEVKPYTPEEFRIKMNKIGWKEALKDKVVILDDYSLFE